MRYVAILRDGYSDFLVIRKFIQTVFLGYRAEEIPNNNFIDLEQLNITNSLTKYLSKVSKTENYSYHSSDAEELIKNLITVYYGCYKRVQTENDIVSNREIIIINADSEKLLLNRINYFSDWAYHIKGLVYYSIERFYEQMNNQGYSLEYLPHIIPLILFPSSEILVASCMYDITTESLREILPNPGLKTKVYSTNSIPEAIDSGVLQKTLDTYLVYENVKEIYKEIPEARMLIHALAC